MQRPSPYTSIVTSKLPYNSGLRRNLWLTGLAVAAAVVLTSQAFAASGLCRNGARCAPTESAADSERQLLEFAATRQLKLQDPADSRRGTLSSQEFFSFSGVGAIVCSVNGKQRMSTAFLVGAFDIGVTVAHMFEDNGVWVSPEHCTYTSTDSLGQIRERIPVSYIKSQWEAEAEAFGQPAKDFAVIRLQEPSRYAQRTMPLGKFSGVASPVLMIGFRADMESNSLKSKSRGTVYERKANEAAAPSLEGFTHDIDARGIAAGAPVIDERTGVIIGVHTIGLRSDAAGKRAPRRNTMITMNEWLENTLRIEMQDADEKGANTAL